MGVKANEILLACWYEGLPRWSAKHYIKAIETRPEWAKERLLDNRPPKEKNGRLAGLGRLVRYKLVVPMKRSPHPPEYTARGVAVGMFLGLTPLVGVQMPLVMILWALGKLNERTNFHLILALAWVWTSNVFTIVPMYYTFYITGQIMLGRFSDLSGYSSFAKAFNFEAWQTGNFWETITNYLAYVAETFGLPLGIGWLPWAILLAWLSYRISLKLIKGRRARLARKRAAANAAAGTPS